MSLWSAKIHRAINKSNSESLNVSLQVLYCSITPLLTGQMNNTVKTKYPRLGNRVFSDTFISEGQISHQLPNHVFSSLKIRDASVKSLLHQHSKTNIYKTGDTYREIYTCYLFFFFIGECFQHIHAYSSTAAANIVEEKILYR